MGVDKITLEQNTLKMQRLLVELSILSDPDMFHRKHNRFLGRHQNRKAFSRVLKKLRRLMIVIQKQSKDRAYRRI